MLKVKNISKQFKHQQVLKDVSFQIQQGQVVHIAGRNGSGKSTLFKIITCLIKPTSGSIVLEPNVTIGALIENPGFIEYESAMTNLKFLASLNDNYDSQKVSKLMEQFYLNPSDNSPVSTYSIGMRQKLGIIQAIMEEQNLILLDEPTRGLDAESIDEFIVLLDQLKSQGKSIIIASHDILPGLVYDRSYKLNEGILLNE